MNVRSLIKKVYLACHMDEILNFFRLFFTPYGHLRNYVFFPIGVCLRKCGISNAKDKEILQLKNIHKGGRIFVVCSGPSLTAQDVLKIKDEYTIGMNSIFKMYDKTGWKPTYYLSLEYEALELYVKNLNIDLKNLATDKCIINSLNTKMAIDPKILTVHYCWLDHWFLWEKKKFKYTPELYYGIYDFYSTGHAAVLLAIYMGFKDIYLIGVDNDFSGSKIHFADVDCPGIIDTYTEEEKKGPGYKMQVSMNQGWVELAKIGQKMGVNICNATRGGKLEAFPRVKLEDVLGC